MTAEFEGKVVMVTGAGGAIGRAAAMAFAGEGACVTVCDLHADSAHRTVALIREAGGEALAAIGDVSAAKDVARAVAETVQRFGGLDYAFNNAGITHPGDAVWDEEAFRRVMECNLFSQMYCLKYQIPEMMRRGKGAIVNTASVLGLVGQADPVMPAYTSSKHAIIGLTKAAAMQYVRSGIRVNALCPGITRSKMIDDFMAQGGAVREYLQNYSPMGRIGEPREMADAVLWLCSDKSSYVTGHALAVDGGFVAR
jgi:NAD(P)-dependent dehydrogenase (short-subunit alcohol dehydrogenase family)